MQHDRQTPSTDQVDYDEAELLASHDYAEPLIVARRPLPRRVRRRRHLRLAPHRQPGAGHRRLAGQAPAGLRHRAARPAARHLARALPERRPGPVPHRERHPRPDQRHADPRRHGRGVRGDDPLLGHSRHAAGRRRGHPRHRAGPPRVAGCSRPTPATRPASTTRAATSTCGTPPATWRSRTRSPRTSGPSCSSAWASRRRAAAARSTPPPCAAAALANRGWPDDVDFDLESLIARMVRLLLIEISAFHTFAWAEELLADPDLVAGDGEGARLVSYIRADETPHVDYLRTALSELRDRTIVGRRRAQARRRRPRRRHVGPRPRPVDRPQPAGDPRDHVGRGAARGRRPSAARPTCWPGSTSWARSAVRTTAPGSRRPPRPDPRSRRVVWRVPHGTTRPRNLRPVDDAAGGLTLTVLGCSGTYAAPGGACSGYLVRSASTTLAVDLGSGTLANLQRHVEHRGPRRRRPQPRAPRPLARPPAAPQRHALRARPRRPARVRHGRHGPPRRPAHQRDGADPAVDRGRRRVRGDGRRPRRCGSVAPTTRSRPWRCASTGPAGRCCTRPTRARRGIRGRSAPASTSSSARRRCRPAEEDRFEHLSGRQAGALRGRGSVPAGWCSPTSHRGSIPTTSGGRQPASSAARSRRRRPAPSSRSDHAPAPACAAAVRVAATVTVRAMRADGRAPDELRPITFARDFTEMAAGSCLVSFGQDPGAVHGVDRRGRAPLDAGPRHRLGDRRVLDAAGLVARARAARGQGRPAVGPQPGDPAADRPGAAVGVRHAGAGRAPGHRRLRRAPGRRRHPHRVDLRRLRGAARRARPPRAAGGCRQPTRSPRSAPPSRSAWSTACRSSTCPTSRTARPRST